MVHTPRPLAGSSRQRQYRHRWKTPFAGGTTSREPVMSNTPDYINDTIVAQATPAGSAGIAVVRLSGPDVPAIVKRMTGALPLPRYATLASCRDASGQILDKGVVIYFPGPHSYTGEHAAELQVHGGQVVVHAIVEAAVVMGARQALPGEFSQRGFLNDKLDLVQAEAIADLIGSSTRQAARAVLRSLSGTFSSAITEVQGQLTELRIQTEAMLDFPDEDTDFLSDPSLTRKTDACDRELETLLRAAEIGRVLRDGYQMVIIGRPNAGKSSLLNALSGQDAAIVTEVAGTTRDIIREQINIAGLAVELVDTAGLRDNPQRVEAEGIRRARQAIREADAILWVQDASVAGTETIRELEPSLDAATPVIVARNKIDLGGAKAGRTSDNPPTVQLSAKTGAGLEALRAEVCRLAGFSDLGEGAFTARRRHLQVLRQA